MADDPRGTWLDPGPLVDGELHLVLRTRMPADPARGWVPQYRFALRVAGHPDAAGEIGLRIGSTAHVVQQAGHVGFSVEPPWRGRRFAARATRLLLPLARRHGLDPLWITCNPDNRASIRTCEILGATLVDTVDVWPGTDMYQRGERRKHRFRLVP